MTEQELKQEIEQKIERAVGAAVYAIASQIFLLGNNMKIRPEITLKEYSRLLHSGSFVIEKG